MVDARNTLFDKVSASLRRDTEELPPQLHAQARDQAELRLLEHGEPEAARALPEGSCYELDRVLERGWYPPNRHGLSGAPHPTTRPRRAHR